MEHSTALLLHTLAWNPLVSRACGPPYNIQSPTSLGTQSRGIYYTLYLVELDSRIRESCIFSFSHLECNIQRYCHRGCHGHEICAHDHQLKRVRGWIHRVGRLRLFCNHVGLYGIVLAFLLMARNIRLWKLLKKSRNACFDSSWERFQLTNKFNCHRTSNDTLEKYKKFQLTYWSYKYRMILKRDLTRWGSGYMGVK